MAYGDSIKGKRFGRLVALGATPERQDGSVIWECECDCGEVVLASRRNLISGGTRSCGCLRSETSTRLGRKYGSGRLSIYDPHVAVLRGAVAGLKSQAIRRGWDWELTYDEALELIMRPCNYCGIDPSNYRNDRQYGVTVHYTGLDRVDNSRGYLLDNVVPCCKPCNVAKNDRSRQDFLDWVRRVYDLSIKAVDGN
jgi:5-methylcytosine-specific restriction endonuclease McrA